MLITTWQKRASLPERQRTLNVKMNGQYLENVTSEKLLGVTLNHNLSWEEHISCVIIKVNSKLALLRHIKGCLPIERDSQIVLQFTHIATHFVQMYGVTPLMFRTCF